MGIQETLSEIDSKPFIKFVSDVTREISSDKSAQIAYHATNLAVRCACLLDLYAETDDGVYIWEFRRQKAEFYRLIPEEYHEELEALEKRLAGFFDYERVLINRIQEGYRFSGEDVITYLEGKSGDNIFYGRILEIIVPEWNLTRELQIQTMLFDIGKDLEDYEDDIRNGLPNVLYMFLSGRVNRNKIHHEIEGAITLANELGISNGIIELASGLREEALASENIDRSPTLKGAILDRYNHIEYLLSMV